MGLENNNSLNNSIVELQVRGCFMKTIQTPSKVLCCPQSAKRETLFINNAESAKTLIPNTSWSSKALFTLEHNTVLFNSSLFKLQKLTPHPSSPHPVFCFNIIQSHLQGPASTEFASCGTWSFLIKEFQNNTH